MDWRWAGYFIFFYLSPNPMKSPLLNSLSVVLSPKPTGSYWKTSNFEKGVRLTQWLQQLPPNQKLPSSNPSNPTPLSILVGVSWWPWRFETLTLVSVDQGPLLHVILHPIISLVFWYTFTKWDLLQIYWFMLKWLNPFSCTQLLLPKTCKQYRCQSVC